MRPLEFGRIFDGYEHPSGLTAVIDNPVFGLTGPQVKGFVERDGARVGSFEFRSRTLGQPWAAWLEDIELSDRRGTGTDFARSFLTWAESRYRSSGITVCEIEARGVGCYVWADLGYRLREPRPNGYPLSRPRETEILYAWCDHRRALIDELLTAQLVDEVVVADLWRRLLSPLEGALRTPADLAAVGRENGWLEKGRPMWLGKALLLHNDWSKDAWYGYKAAP